MKCDILGVCDTCSYHMLVRRFAVYHVSRIFTADRCIVFVTVYYVSASDSFFSAASPPVF
jgi:hypothetical protein